MLPRAPLLIPFLAICLSAGSARAETYSYIDLIQKMKDLEGLATLPDSGEKTLEFSSTDRSSTYSSADDTYHNWSANNDGVSTVRPNDDGGRIMAEMTGPGCIRRINGATSNTAHVKIFLDGSTVPAVDLAWDDYFIGTQTPFVHGTLAYRISGGFTNYYPIPYQKSCKVVAYDNWSSYYFVEYTTFPKGTVVPTFTRTLTAEEKAALANLDDYFSHGLGSDPVGARPAQTTDSNAYAIVGGQTVTLLDQPGEGAITGIRIRVNALATKAEQWAALRELAISMRWDGESAPSVWAPLGDFFGSACGLNPYRALPLGILEDGWMYAYWYMPFAAGAKVTLKNDGTKSRAVQAVLVRAALTKPIGTLARFHAKWNRNMFQPVRKDRWPDYTVLKTTGRGRFLGFMLHLFKPDDQEDPASGAGNYWWGEGDEKFFLDGEKFPSWFGTGSEDYFGYAWATPDLFSKPYHSQAFNEGGIHWKGNRVLNRFQITDNIAFQSSFEGTIEKYYSDAYARYGVMPYWYLAPGGNDAYGEVPLSERTGYYESPQAGDTTRIEGEDMTVLSRTGGSLTPQYMDWASLDGWSNRRHLFWYKNNLSDVQANSSAVLGFSVGRAADYHVRLNLTQAFDYGTIRFSLDGTACGDAVDLYHDGPVTTGEKEFCTRSLYAGNHQLTLTVTGKNAAAQGYYMGLDYVKLIPAPAAVMPGTLSASALLQRWYPFDKGIAFEVSPEAEEVALFDSRGGRLATLKTKASKAVWNGTDAAGAQAGNGGYLVRVMAGSRQAFRSILLMR